MLFCLCSVAQMLSSRRYDLEGFVYYAQTLIKDSKNLYSRELANKQWVDDIYAILRKYGIQPAKVLVHIHVRTYTCTYTCTCICIIMYM